MTATPNSVGPNASPTPPEISNRLVQWLSEPSSYPEKPAAVERVETHISCVFLTGEFAYKLKKPVRFDFLDFSTADLRRHACQEEIRLNRRLAPDVYLGIVAVRQTSNGNFYLDESSTSDDNVIDWLVKMHRLPVASTLDAKIRSASVDASAADAIAQRLARFYKSTPPLPITPQQYRTEIERHVRANLTALLQNKRELDSALIKRVHAAQLQALLLQPDLFDARVAARRIVDGHGDLRPEHIYLLANHPSGPNTSQPTNPAIIDCIEFNAEFRHLDIADELCFLATECDFLGAAEIGDQILAQTSAALGDHPPPYLLAFYRTYRACVRAKVAALRARQQSASECESAYTHARQHLQLADRYAHQLPAQFLLVVSGLMGAGKSTLAARLAGQFSAELLSTDSIRQQVFGKSDQPLEYGAGHYRRADRMHVYDEMFRAAEQNFKLGLPVILDGAFPFADLRTRAWRLAQTHNSPSIFIRCHCPEEIARSRIAARFAAGQDHSEARPELYERQREEHEPDPNEIQSLEIDTTQPLDKQLEQVIQELRSVQLPNLNEARLGADLDQH